MDGINLRLREFLRSKDGRGVIVDTSAGLALGSLPGLDDFGSGVRPILAAADGVVCSPGQLRRLTARTHGDAALLVRVDWTNTLRGADFALPPAESHRVPLLGAREAFDLWAVAMVASFLLGYEEEIEAACLQNCVQWALEGKALGLPLVVEARPTGPRVAIPDKAVELCASYALEAGADVIVVPYPGSRALEEIGQFVSVPWLCKPSSPEAEAEVVEALERGAAGAWLDHSLFSQPDPAAAVKRLAGLAHQAVGV